jgi:hypothetical protein
MKTILLTILAAYVTSTLAGVAETRTWIDPLAMFLTSKVAVSTTNLEPSIPCQGAKRTAVKFGPFTIKATNVSVLSVPACHVHC